MSLELQAEIGLRLFVALVLGAVIGIEREYHDHPAGLRTLALVAFGSCLFTALGAYLFGRSTDPTRIAAQVVTGIGFLGAGAILRTGDGIKGLTTAATIWVVAAIGMAVAFNLYLLAMMGTAMVLAWLLVFRLFEERIFHKERPEPRLRFGRRKTDPQGPDSLPELQKKPDL
jgi:putative Mg2+ transporter-C (MgtC) family protein